MNNDEGWVTGAALQIVLELKALQRGDEVMAGPCQEHTRHNDAPADHPFYNRPLLVEGTDDHPDFPIDVRMMDEAPARGWCCCPYQIVAWRRRVK